MPAEPARRPRARARELFGTVRFRVTALATLVLVVVLVATAVGLVLAQRAALRDSLEDGLRRRADDIAALVRADGPPPSLADGGDDTVAQVVSPAGEVLAASPNISGEPPIAELPPGARQRLHTIDLPTVDDGSFRVLSIRFDATPDPVVVNVAGTLDEVDESIGVLVTSLAIAIPVVAVMLAALVWWLVGRTLRPVEAIRAEVAEMGSDLRRRVPEPPGNDEIARLARTMNAMLGRVETATERQRRFAADASHELRSPLTRVRSELEVDLAHPDTADPLATHRSVLAETIALERLVDDLLHLARRDAGGGADEHNFRDVDLDDVVLREVERLRAESDVEIDTRPVSAAQVRGDAAALGRVVRNLADNAARHATSRVTFEVAERDGRAMIAVVDDGPGIPLAEQERVFERFTRLEDARSRASGGTGLGLAIAREIVARHGGDVRVDPDHAPGARVVVTLPITIQGGVESRR